MAAYYLINTLSRKRDLLQGLRAFRVFLTFLMNALTFLNECHESLVYFYSGCDHSSLF